jgi:hypothetical protein
MVLRCPAGVSASSIVTEVHVCGNDSIGIGRAVVWQVQCNMSMSRSNGEDIMVVRCPIRRLGIVCCDRSCMSEQWATIHQYPLSPRIGIASLLVSTSRTLCTTLLSIGIPHILASLLIHRLRLIALSLQPSVSPLFLHTNQPPYQNTQTFPAEQSSLQLYNTVSKREPIDCRG